MNQQKLHEALRLLRAENAAAPVPANLEEKIMAAFDGRNEPRPSPARARWWLPTTAVALTAAFALAAFLWHSPAPLPQEAEAPFIAIPYVAPPAPYERTEVNRMDVPLAALIAAGVEVHATDAGGSVLADVLLGQDGRPLAIRLAQAQSKRCKCNLGIDRRFEL